MSVYPQISHYKYSNPPCDDASLQDCIRKAYNFVVSQRNGRQDFLSLNFRTLCLPKALVAQGFNAVSSVINVSTMYPVYKDEHPDIAKTMDFATRAGIASLLLHRATPEPLHLEQRDGIGWALAYYRKHIIECVEQLDTNATLDDLRFIAASCTLRPGANVPNRDWEALLKDDIKWCLAAEKQEWPTLIQTYPQTRAYFETLFIVNTLVPPMDALRHVWYSATPTEHIALPDLEASV